MKFVAVGDCQTGHRTRYEVDTPVTDYYWSDFVKTALPSSTLVSRGNELTGWHGWWKRWDAEVLAEKPDVVIVFGGIYHFSMDADPNPTLREVATKMTESSKENGIILVLCSMQPFRSADFWTEKRQRHLDSFNAWLSKFCSSEGIIFVDAFEILRAPDSQDLREEYFFSGSKFHINVEGHKVLGDFIASKLNHQERQ